MKKLTLLSALAISAVLSACNSQVGYNVTANGAEDGTVVTLTDMLSGETIESAEVADGSVTFTGKADKNALLMIQKEDSNWQSLFFADGKPVSINLSDNSLSGSELNEKLTAYDIAASEVYDNALKAISEYSELSKEEQEAQADAIQEEIQKVSDSYKQILDENRDNIIPAAFVSSLSQMLSDEEFAEAMDEKYPYAKHPYAKKIKAQIDDYNARMAEMEAAKDKLIGTKFIDLEEPDVDGKMHKLSEYVGVGKWVLIDFWASWCGPCRREMPNVVAAYEKYHAKGLDIVGLSFDNEKEAWVEAIKELNMPWIHLSDLQGWQTVASDTYGVKSIPASLLVDPEGTIVARDLRGDALGAKLAEVFGE
ncbi:MAG: AhpC/TSA family protein [Bacteroidales bacterium]|nr:AhpC/TSA family protein [Bacteroidales bacterium]